MSKHAPALIVAVMWIFAVLAPSAYLVAVMVRELLGRARGTANE